MIRHAVLRERRGRGNQALARDVGEGGRQRSGHHQHGFHAIKIKFEVFFVSEQQEHEPFIEARHAALVRDIELQIQKWDEFARYYRVVGLSIQITLTLFAGALPVLLVMNVSRFIVITISMILALLVMATPVWQFDSKVRYYFQASHELRRTLYLYKFSSSNEKINRLQALTEEYSRLMTEPDSRWLQSVGLERDK